MKLNSDTIIWNIGIFIWSIFMGVTAVSIGFGAVYPPLNLIAKPILCPTGQMTYQESTSNPMPGTTVTQIGWSCVTNGGDSVKSLDIFSIALVAGPVYGLVIEVVALVVQWLRGRNVAPGQNGASNPYRTTPTRHNRPAPSDDSVRRMRELKELHAQGLISEAEYQQKRDEILKDL